MFLSYVLPFHIYPCSKLANSPAVQRGSLKLLVTTSTEHVSSNGAPIAQWKKKKEGYGSVRLAVYKLSRETG